MTHDELLAKINSCFSDVPVDFGQLDAYAALCAVVELHHKDFGTPGEDVVCDWCKIIYPCPTIQAIEKKLM